MVQYLVVCSFMRHTNLSTAAKVCCGRKEAMDNKKNIAIVFGGQSSEHEVSCVSATTIIKNIDKNKYDLTLIGITQDGRWRLVDSVESIEHNTWRESLVDAIISPDSSDHGIIITTDGAIKKKRIDAVFPVLHGLWGEDGTIQGLCELACIPYVGCGVLSSSVSMDKIYTKLVVEKFNIRQAKYTIVLKPELNDIVKVVRRVEGKLPYPIFVKPSNAGSSKGVSKAHNREELVDALYEAAKHDRKILLEETIVGREIECGVLGGAASGVGEVISADEFYSYDAKYNNEASKTIISPELPEGKEEEIRKTAEIIFAALDGYGLARVDFFLENGTNEVVFNEINTLPGFTSISMFPMLWNAQGVRISQQIDRLIEQALVRYER